MKWLFFSLLTCCLILTTKTVRAQQTLAFQGGETGDTWTYTSTGASTLAISEATQTPNKVTGTTSIVAGGNTGGGNCFDTGSGNGPSVARTFTFSNVDISTSNQSVRTLVFNWGNRYPMCTGTGWDSGENLVFTPYLNGIAQSSVTFATGNNNAQFSILTHQYTYSIPACINTFSFVVSVTTNRADELLFLDDVKLSAPAYNTSVPLTISGNTAVCQGTAGTYGVANSGGTTYAWSVSPSGPAFSSANGISSIGIDWTGATPGTSYTITVIPTSACSGTGTPATLTVAVNPAATAPTISGPTSICPGQSITLTSSYASGNTWSTGATTQSVTVTSPGVYSVSQTGSCGTMTAQYTVGTGSGPAISSVAVSNVSCFGMNDGSASISAAGAGLQYSIDNVNWQSAQSFSPLAPGSHTFYVRNPNGCVSDTTISVTEPSQVVATASNNGPVCAGTNAQLSGNSSITGASYSWTGPGGYTSTNQSPNNITIAGNYSLTVTANGCTSQPATTTVSFTAPPVATASNSGPYCAGQTISLTGSSSVTGSTFSWTGPGSYASSVQNPSNATAAGTYTLTATANGCAGTPVTTAVTVNPVPVATASAGGPYCAGQAIALTGSSDITGATFSWTGPNGFTSSVQSPSNATAAGTYTLTVSTAGCSSSPATVDVVMNPVPAATASSGGPYCAGQSISLTGSSTVAGASYSWAGPNSFTSSVQNPSNATAAGTYTLTVSATGCVSSPASVTVLVTAIPDAQATYNSPYCPGNSLVLSGSTTGSGVVSYSWSGPGSYTSQVQNPTDATAAGTYTLIITQNGCSSSPATLDVIQPAMAVNAANAGPYCPAEIIALQSFFTGSGTPAYHWTGPNGYTSSAANPSDASEAGVYTLTVTMDGCSLSSPTTVILSDNPLAGFSASDVCQGEPVHFTSDQQSQQGVVSNWSFGDGTASQDEEPWHNFSSSGTYSVTQVVQNAAGCTASATHTVTVYARPKSAFLTASDTVSDVDPRVEFINTSQGAVSYEWTFGETGEVSHAFSPSYTFSGTKDYYTVRLVSFNEPGCSDTLTRTLIGGSSTLYYVPNAFSPDGDEFNSTFQPVFVQGFDPMNFQLLIFNRWGEVLFESHDAAIGWDGTYQGKLSPSGTYVWQIVFHHPNNGKAEQLQGHLSLLR